MDRLEIKSIKGHKYYYYSQWARVDGKPRRIVQKYLGKLEDIVHAVTGEGQGPICADLFEWGLPEALWRISGRTEMAASVDRQCGKSRRGPGLTTGEYLVIAALNRAIRPQSKRAMWSWFSQTSLLRSFPEASELRLTSQRFWDELDRIQEQDIEAIWSSVLQRVLQEESFDLSSICYDGTNYYTFIDTFNSRCDVARRGKNKQGRDNLRQVSFALFCCADGQLPLYFDVYAGNRNDSKEFPLILAKFHQFLKNLGQAGLPVTTLIFDKGNNSVENFALVDQLQSAFVGAVKLGEHPELAQVPNDDPRFVVCTAFPGTKAFRVRKEVYGRERTLVITHSQKLFDSQYKTLHADINKASQALSALQQRLELRIQGVVTKGKAPTVASIRKQATAVLRRQHLKKLIQLDVTSGKDGVPRLQYRIDAEAMASVTNTYLGKNLLISSRDEWTDEQIIKAYRSQFQIEEIFKESKDRVTGSWWPMHHWTDSKIRVHGLYCTLALLMRSLLMRRVRKAGLNLSMKKLLATLGGIREVVNIYPAKRGKQERLRTVLSRRSALQARLMSILDLEAAETAS